MQVLAPVLEDCYRPEMDEDCTCLWCKKGEIGASAEVLRVVRRYGLAVVPIIGSNPQLTFSIGLSHSYRHPELIVFGIAARVAQELLNTCAVYIKKHGTLEAGRRYDDFANLPTVFRVANPLLVKPYVSRCSDFYGGKQPPFMQLVWPDAAGILPWEAGFNQSFDVLQPKLWLDVLQIIK